MQLQTDLCSIKLSIQHATLRGAHFEPPNIAQTASRFHTHSHIVNIFESSLHCAKLTL